MNALLSLLSLALTFLYLSQPALGRERWLERNSKPVYFYPRRFGQEHPAVLNELGSACAGQICGNLAGQAVSTLLADADQCAQQNLADQIIDASKQFDATTQANMIQIAKTFRQVEKNTPPDFTSSPPIYRNSVFCQTGPNNTELNGLVQAQDPANDPNIFFDPATGKSVTKGSQPNTLPFVPNTTHSINTTRNALVVDSVSSCQSAVTVTVSASIAAPITNNAAVTVSVGSVAASPTPTSSSIGNFGSCSVPLITFGVGFDGRKETSFEPSDKNSFNHGSADNIDIITQFICDTLTNSCDADQTAKNICQSASSAADQAAAKTGAQADAFNRAFGAQTNFAAIPAVDDQGNVVAGTGDAASGESSSPVSSSASTTTNATSVPSSSGATSPTTVSSSSIGNFGSCSVPQIKFGVGFDNRKETSFEPADQYSYPHGSADDIDIITQFMCDTLTNTCGADQTAKNTCATASAAADAKTAKTGAQADAFNAVFGIESNFAVVAEVDDQGNVVADTGSEADSTSQDTQDTSSQSLTTSSSDSTSSSGEIQEV